MFPKVLSVAVIAPALAGGVLLFSGGAAFAAAQNFTANLSGSNEVPPGNAGMTGKATVTVDSTSGQVCAKVTTNVTGAVAMHIHKGAAGANGPVVVTLDVKAINGASVCSTVTPAIAAAITANPAGHYVNIHSPQAPAGVTRGQLAAAAPSAVSVPSGVSAGSGGQAGTTSGTSALLVPMVLAGAGLAGAAGWRLVRS